MRERPDSDLRRGTACGDGQPARREPTRSRRHRFTSRSTLRWDALGASRRAALQCAEWIGGWLVEHQRQIAVLRRLDPIGGAARQIDVDLCHQRRAIDSDAHAPDRPCPTLVVFTADVTFGRFYDNAPRSILRFVDACRNQS